MNIKDLFSTVWSNMWKRKGRTIFTMSGVIIGCLAIFMIVSITNGLESYITDSMTNMIDTKTLNIYPNYEGSSDKGSTSNTEIDKTKSLDDSAIEEISKLPYVVSVFGKKDDYGAAKYKSRSVGFQLSSSEFESITDDEKKKNPLLLGEYPTKDNDVVISYSTAYDLVLSKKESENGMYFKYEKDASIEERFSSIIGKQLKFYKDIYTPEGDILKSKTVKLKVVGIKDFTGSWGEWSNDVSIDTIKDTIKLDTSMDKMMLKEKLNSNNELVVKVDDDSNLETYVTEIQRMGYMVQSPLDFVKEMQMMMLAIKLILGFLAGISLLVATFGIINTMEMAIYERNKEIGVMKVLGCSLRDVKRIFIYEASAISGLGGLISIFIGLVLNGGINSVAKMATASMPSGQIDKIACASPSLIISIIVFSVLIGMFAGWKPSKKAVNIDVVSAVR